MKKTSRTSILLNIHFLIITIIALGAVTVLSVINKPQTIAQYASDEVNLNTASEIQEVLNGDNTMGPATIQENLSSSMPSFYRGNLKILIKDSNFGRDSDPEYLKIVLSKAENKLIYLFLPGTKRNSASGETPGDGRKTNQNVNKWETIFPEKSGDKTQITINSTNDEGVFNSSLAGGKYSELRLYIDEAEIKYKNQEAKKINIPDKAGLIRVLRPYNIYSEEVTTVVLDINTSRSVVKSGDEYFLAPVIINASTN